MIYSMKVQRVYIDTSVLGGCFDRLRAMETTNIKAVELVRRIRDNHYEQLKDKTREERMAFYRAKAQALHEKAHLLLQEQQDEEQ